MCTGWAPASSSSAIRCAKLAAEKSGRGNGPTLFQALTSRLVLALSLCYFGVEVGLYGVILWIPQVFGWIKDATGSFRWGLLAVAGSVLLTEIIAVLIGHDSAAEHGNCRRSGLKPPGRKSTNKAVGRAA
jgi:formate hydrogenlyase subunit 3/multisubunit Na+/H+ antiporter MnhD subunit